MDLQEIEAIGPEPAKALLESRSDVVRAVVVGEWRRRAWRWIADEAPALRREEVLISTTDQVLADQLLATPVVDRGVDQVDALVEHCIEELACVLVGDRRSPRLAPQLHGAVPEDGHGCSGTPEGASFDGHSRDLSQPVLPVPHDQAGFAKFLSAGPARRYLVHSSVATAPIDR